MVAEEAGTEVVARVVAPRAAAPMEAVVKEED